MNNGTNFLGEGSKKQATEYFTTEEIITGSVFLVVLILSAIIGNVLTCLIIYKKPSFRTGTNISILFLAVSDISSAILVMPLSLASLIHGKWLFSPEACTFTAFINSFLMGVSLSTMTCTALIRYLCVVKPALHQQYVKPKTVAIGISVLWLGCLIVQTIAGFVLSANGLYDKRRTTCIYENRLKVPVDIFNFSTLAGAFFLGSIIFFAYFKVFRFVSHHNHTVASNLQPGNHLHIEEAKITKTLVIVVLGFVFCWVPTTTIQFIDSVVYSQFGQLRMPNFVFLFQTIFIFTSSAVNPFIYGFTSKRFRKQYFELLGVLCPSAPQVFPVVVGTS